MNRSITGWIVAAVLAVVLAGVLVFQVGGGDGGRPAAIGGREAASQGPPPEVADDVAKIKEAKEARGGKETFAKAPPGLAEQRVDARPENACDPTLPPNVFAEWRNTANNLNEAKGKASRIFVGTVENVENGQGLTAEAATEAGGKVETATQRVTLRIDDNVKGQGNAGDRVTIEALGDGERGCSRVAGDPPYKRGEQYLLMLEDGKSGRPAHTFAPEGRFRVAPDKILQAMEDNSHMRDVAQQKLEDVIAKLKAR